MAQPKRFSAVIEKKDDWYIALCPELDVASQGKNIEEALSNLREAVELHLDDGDVKTRLAKSPAAFL